MSGPAVDATGHRPGLLGLADLLPGRRGRERVIGAISESINEYGGKVALATPIEAIIGTPVDVPGPAERRDARRASARRPGGAARKLSPRMRAALASARPIAAPLTVSGLSAPVANALTAAAAKAGRPVLAVPPGPLGTFPPQTLRPGSAVAVGYSNGDVRTSAVGTVAYVDGDRVWVFGHAARGRRAARAAAAGRVRLPDRQQPAAARRDRRDLQARGLRARPRDDQLGRVQRGRGSDGRAPAHGAGAGDRARPGHATGCATRATRAPRTRRRSTCRAAGRGRRSSRRSRSRRPRAACSAARRRG